MGKKEYVVLGGGVKSVQAEYGVYMGFKPIEVIRPKSEADLNRCRELDKEGKLIHGGSPDQFMFGKEPTNQKEVNFHIIHTYQSSSEEQNNDDK